MKEEEEEETREGEELAEEGEFCAHARLHSNSYYKETVNLGQPQMDPPCRGVSFHLRLRMMVGTCICSVSGWSSGMAKTL